MLDVRGSAPDAMTALTLRIVGTALYLAGDWSSFTTGSVITVDGGSSI